MKRNIIILLIIALASGIGIAYYQFTKTYTDTDDLKTEASLSSTELYLEFSSDEISAAEKYVGKIIEVSGEIAAIEKGSAGEQNILLAADGQIFGVSCNVEQNIAHLSLEKGQSITIKGECSGFLSDVILIRCILKNEAK